jgi:hypothetical protein
MPIQRQIQRSSLSLYLRTIPLSLGYVLRRKMPSYMRLMPPDVKDVDWHASDENLFVSVGDDKMLKM